jgi:two-component system response regulator RegX3
MARIDAVVRRVLVIEDEESIAGPLSASLRRAGFEVCVAGRADEGLRDFDAWRPDVVLLDVMLPDRDGRDVLRELRPSGVPVVLVTARSDRMDKVVGLELGADDYVTKPFDMGELVARIRAVLRRTTQPEEVSGAAQNGVLSVGDVEVDLGSRIVTRGGRRIDLALKEFELLRILFEHAGQVVRRGALMDELWGPDWYGSDKKLDVHMSTLRHKLGEDPMHPQLIFTVRGVGFRAARVVDSADGS